MTDSRVTRTKKDLLKMFVVGVVSFSQLTTPVAGRANAMPDVTALPTSGDIVTVDEESADALLSDFEASLRRGGSNHLATARPDLKSLDEWISAAADSLGSRKAVDFEDDPDLLLGLVEAVRNDEGHADLPANVETFVASAGRFGAVVEVWRELNRTHLALSYVDIVDDEVTPNALRGSITPLDGPATAHVIIEVLDRHGEYVTVIDETRASATEYCGFGTITDCGILGDIMGGGAGLACTFLGGIPLLCAAIGVAVGAAARCAVGYTPCATDRGAVLERSSCGKDNCYFWWRLQWSSSVGGVQDTRLVLFLPVQRPYGVVTYVHYGPVGYQTGVGSTDVFGLSYSRQYTGWTAISSPKCESAGGQV